MAKGKAVHVRRFMGGTMTPQEVHTQALNMRCEQCGAPAAERIRVLVQLKELVARNPEYVAQIMATNPDGPSVPTVPTKYGPMVKVSDVGACRNCAAAAEKAAARGPSWAIVEITRGPDPTNRVVVQVPGALS